MFNNTNLANDVANEIRKHYPNELIDIPIPRTVRVSEAPGFKQTVMTYDPGSPGASCLYGCCSRTSRARKTL